MLPRILPLLFTISPLPLRLSPRPPLQHLLCKLHHTHSHPRAPLPLQSPLQHRQQHLHSLPLSPSQPLSTPPHLTQPPIHPSTPISTPKPAV
ncbi:unnamed protein product [Closterium sp. NIES-54]